MLVLVWDGEPLARAKPLLLDISLLRCDYRAIDMVSAACAMVVDLDQRAKRAHVAPYAADFSNIRAPRTMETVYFTLTAIACYLISDWALKRLEAIAGRRFEHRTLIFFALILSLALASFALVRNFAGA